MGFAITLVRFINDVARLSAVTYSLILTIDIMVLVVAYQTFTPYNRN